MKIWQIQMINLVEMSKAYVRAIMDSDAPAQQKAAALLNLVKQIQEVSDEIVAEHTASK